MADRAVLACCVDLPRVGGWTERRGFCRAALPQTSIEFAYRRGGQVVWVTVVIPAGSATLTIADLRRRIGAAEAGHSSSAIPSCSQRARSAIPITRPSCCTGWHRVAMNTEQGAPRAMRHVAFLD